MATEINEEVPTGLPIELNDLSFARLEVLEAREVGYHANHVSLIKEAEGHILNLLNWFLMVAAVSITGSFTAGSVECRRGISIAIASACLLTVSYVPLFVYAWIMVEDCRGRLSLLREKMCTLGTRISELREYYIHLKNANVVSEHSDQMADFHSRLDYLDLLLGADMLDRGIWYIVRMMCLSIIALAYSIGLPYTLYCRVCSPGSHTQV